MVSTNRFNNNLFTEVTENEPPLPITKTMTILSDPISKKFDNDDNDKARLQMRWSDSSSNVNSGGSDAAEIREDSEDHGLNGKQILQKMTKNS